MDAKKNGELGFIELLSISIGTVIGAGIVSSTGAAIAKTGSSVWLAYSSAVILGFFLVIPPLLYSSVVRFRGGYTTMISSLMGEKWGGMYSLYYILTMMNGATIGKALGMYVNSVFPQISVQVGGIIMVTIMFAVNMFGIKAMANSQKVMVTLLIICLAGFSLIGFTKLLPGTFYLAEPDRFLNGSDGFLQAMILLIGSCTGHGLVIAYSQNAKKPTTDIPKVILCSSIIILVLYTSVALVAGNTVPVDQVAGKPLTVVANAILPRPLFVLFIICGPLLALSTTLNSGYSATSAPVFAGIRDGWMPAFLGKTNKHDVPYVLYGIKYLVQIVPLLIGYDLTALIANMVLINNLTKILVVISMFFMPKKFEGHWEKSKLYISNTLYYPLITLVLILQVGVIVLSTKQLPPSLIALNFGGIVILSLYALYRYKTGKVVSTVKYSFED